MIELLVDYICSKGFEVIVWPGILRIYKLVDGQECVCSFHLSRIQIAQSYKEVLLAEADMHMQEIDEMIEKYRATGIR